MSSVSLLRQVPDWDNHDETNESRYKSVSLKLKGKFLDSLNEEHRLVTEDVSCGGATIMAKHRPDIGDNIVCYIDDFARIAGTVAKHTGTGFTLAFAAPQQKRERLADRLVWLLNAERLGLSEDRRETRIPVSAPCKVIRKDGETIECRVLDISLSGANFESDTITPQMDEVVRAGGVIGTVVRREKRMFAIQFITPKDPEQERLDALKDRVKNRLEKI